MANGTGREFARVALAGVAGLAGVCAGSLACMVVNFASAKLLVFRA